MRILDSSLHAKVYARVAYRVRTTHFNGNALCVWQAVCNKIQSLQTSTSRCRDVDVSFIRRRIRRGTSTSRLNVDVYVVGRRRRDLIRRRRSHLESLHKRRRMGNVDLAIVYCIYASTSVGLRINPSLFHV